MPRFNRLLITGAAGNLGRVMRAGLAPLAVQAMKKILHQAASGSINRDEARALSQRCLESADLQEGFAAQREKRKPLFKGG